MQISNDTEAAYLINGVYIKSIARQKFLVLDVEATGLDVKEDHITDFACIPVVDGKILASESFSSLVKSPKPIPSKIEKLTGISNESISKAPLFENVIKHVLNKYKDYIWIAQCGLEFDFPIIRNLCERYGIAFTPEVMDTKVLFAFLNKGSDETFSTDFLKNYFKIDSTDLKRHTALGDTILVARILERIIDVYRGRGVVDLDIDSPLLIKKFIPQKL